MFLRTLPYLISHLYWLLREDNLGNEIPFNDKVTLGAQVLNLLIGYLLFINNDVVANYFDRKKDNS